MQRGTITKHGRGWRGSWREDGRRRTTPVCRTSGEAKRLLKVELDRLELGAGYRAPITVRELGDRFLAAHQGQQSTVDKLRHNLKRLCTVIGDLQATDVTAEEVETWLNRQGYAATYRWALVTALRQTYNWGIRAKLVSDNPAKAIRASKPKRGQNQAPFESWVEVERVAAEAGRWGAFIILAVDTGARPGELRALEHRHVDLAAGVAYLPGSKTANSRRTVHLTSRGIAAYQSIPRSLRTPLVFHGNRDHNPLGWKWFHKEVWQPAVKLAGLDARPPYSCRHTFAYFSLRAGVPIADLAVEMGHDNVAITSETYGHWSREMGDRAASLREAWAEQREEREAK
jgi:integrase